MQTADNATSVLYSQIQLSKCVAINAATAYAHYELWGHVQPWKFLQGWSTL